MLGSVRRVGVAGAVCCVVGLGGLVAPVVALGEDALSAEGAGASLFEGPPVVPGVQGLDGDQQALDAEQVQRSSPAAFLARERSQTEFEHLGTAKAAQVAREAFTSLVEQRAGGTPALPAGQRITSYLSPDTARLMLAGGKHGVIESIGPMAKETSHGHFVPIDLGLKEAGGDYVPTSSNVAVEIPKHLASGVRAPGAGVSLTPVDTQGVALAGSAGSVDGTSVIYPNTQTDMDTVAKPTSMGYEISEILRSIDSPRELDYRVGIPSGARLVQKHRGGPVQVLDDGISMATILPPSARDAAGTAVPVSMDISGRLLALKIGVGPGEYRWPIEVDPELVTTEDRSLTGAVFPVEVYTGGTNWLEYSSNSAFHYEKHYSCGSEWYWCEQSWGIEPRAAFNGSEFAGIRYKTQGVSKAYKLEAWVSGEDDPNEARTEIEFNNSAGTRTNNAPLSYGPYYKYEPALVCSNGSGCAPSEAAPGNSTSIITYTGKAEGSSAFWTYISDARVYVAQENGPETSYNTTSEHIAGAGNRTNVLYGSGSWLGPYSGAYEVVSKDPGVGVSYAKLEGNGVFNQEFLRTKEGDCKGIQCNEKYTSSEIYTPGMADGDNIVKFLAEDAVGLYSYTEQIIKVDATKPYKLEVTGWSKNREISAAPHTLTVAATDGTSPTPSSGVKSISVSLDGGQANTISGASCAPGECTASGKYTLDAESLTEGVHKLVVTAIDNADNEAAEEFTFDVRHASPVSVGPGSVDPTTGQFSLSASDVSLSGTSGVSRTYQSRNLTAGVGGPLGPQWAISIGAGQNLVVLPTGSVVLTASNGGRTTFTRTSKGEFESPLGDSDLKVEAKEPEKGKGITEYLLVDASAGTTTRFTQPTGTESTAPLYTNQFGAEVSQLSHPVSDAVDSSGNVWVADTSNNRLEKFSAAGILQGAYGSDGSHAGELTGPWGVAVNQSTGNVYVTDQGNNRVEELSSSGAFIETFGWGVTDGKAEFETCTSGCRAGIAGSGNGQFYVEAGIAVDPSGNVWVADYGNSRVQEFSEKGAFIGAFGSVGSGNGQLKGPLNIAFSGGHVYVTDYGNNRVQEFSTTGAYVSQFGSSGSGNGQFSDPYGIAAEPKTGNLYVTDAGNNRVQEFTTSGTYVAKFGSAGTGKGQFNAPTGVVVSLAGGIYVVDDNNSRVQEWTRPTWVPTLAEGALASGDTTYAYKAVEVEGETEIEPLEVSAPAPAGVTCGAKPEELKMGCRALTFKYATETTATGEVQSQWGKYKGHLEKVEFTGYNPAVGSEKMEEKAVVEYSYDSQGRLRAEWDPRIEHPLMTVYGYDAEGHVTALTPPGQESWTFTYGTTVGDTGTGRLLKVTRAPASAGLWKGEVPKDSETPKLSGSTVVGISMGASAGSWSNAPVSYTYQWEDCNGEGKACTPILGATNANYTLTSTDVGHTLVVVVGATNGGGTVTVSSTKSTIVVSKAGAFTQLVDSGYSLNAVSCISGTTDCVLSDNTGEAFYATNVSVSAAAKWKFWFGSDASPSEAVDCTSISLCMLAAGSHAGAGGNLYYATSLGGAWGEAYSPAYGVDAISCVSTAFCVAGQDGGGYFRYATSPASSSWTLEEQSTASMKSVSCLSSSFCAIVDGAGKVHVATSTSKIESSSWAETDVDGSSALNGVACTATSSCVAVDGAGDVLNLKIEASGAATASKHDLDGTTSLTALTCTGSSTCVTVDASGDVFVSRNNGETWSKEYALGDKLTSVSCASSSLCATVDTTGNVTGFNPNGGTGTEGEYHAPQPGSTIEYHVPVSGSGLPTVTESEVAKWGQKDDPTEGIAVFPPDEPMGWPAKDYKRATIHYWDEEGRMVDTEVPGGGIGTSEYNETNDVVRTLSADNRAAALKEGSKSAEASAKLDTKSTYSASGGELLETVGPEHEVKRGGGGEVQARDHAKYYHDEGAKEVEEKTHETYGLVTKAEDFGETASKEKFDERITKTSYSGQANLGWKLRKPTSVTTDPGGLNLTSTTKYEETTGDVLETQTPAASGKDALVPPAYSLAFGAKGSSGGQFEGPEYDAVDSHGDVWVADYANHRMQELSASGTFMLAVGWGVKDGKAEAETCTSSCKAGISGAGNGQFEGPYGIAINQSSGNVYVADYLANRVEELSSTGAFVASFGSKGTGGGQFGSPEGLAIDASGDVWVADSANNRIQELSSSGTFMLAIGWGVKDGKAEAETCTASCEVGVSGAGNGQLAGPTGIAFSGGNAYVSDNGNDRVDEFSAAGAYVAKFGSKGTGAGQFEGASAIAAEATGGDLYVADSGNGRVQKLTAAGAFVAAFGSKGSGNGQLLTPAGVAVNSTGSVYVSDHGNARVEQWVPAITGNAGGHEDKTIYYTTATNSEYPSCGGHPEWANLPCETKPVAQPGTGGLPELPITTVTYNIWDEIEKSEEKFGSTTRTKTQTYDPAGRALTSEETSTVDTALPKVTNEYSTETGALVKQSTTTGEKTKSIASVFNTLGQLTSYTDAGGATTTYEYEKEKDARLTKMSYTIEKEGFSQTYGYNETTGELQELTDASTGTDPAAGKFTATYDVEGKMLTEVYPNNMTATYNYNSLGQATGIGYVKNADCAKTCPETWFSDSVTPSIHGETLVQTSTLAKDSYAYDKDGRLTESQETPAGKGCTTRLYGYDEESNRTTLTKRESGTEACATEGGSTEWHTYDTANRPTDPGIAYEALGNTTTLPAADAGGNALTSSYYVDGQVASQTQSEKTIDYRYDPAGRTEETEATVKGKPESTVIDHYAGSGEALTWSSEGTEKWSRNIPGIDGALDAIQTNAGTPTLQLHDLQGDIVATVKDSEAETKLASTYNSTEFGVPQPGTTLPKYAWLGANGLATELASGTATKGGVSYVPQDARNLQTEPVIPPGAFPDGKGEETPYTATVSSAELESTKAIAEQIFGEIEAARQKAEAEKAAAELKECQEEGGCGAQEEGGDPCKTSYAQGSLSYPAVGEVAAAWATISWCYNGHRVVSAGEKNHGDHVYNHWYSPVGTEFLGWTDKAEWLSNGVYLIQRIAVFHVEVEDDVPSEFEGGVAPQAEWSFDMEFELHPDGEASVWTSYSCSPSLTCP